MKRKSFPAINIGTVTLMMVFIILCMITLAALTLSSSIREAGLKTKTADRLTEYYTASNQAEELLAQADAACALAYEASGGKKEYFSFVEQNLTAEEFEILREENSLRVSYRISVNDFQALDVLIDILPYQQAKDNPTDAFYRILSWKVVGTDAWEGDNTLHLIQ